MTETIPHEIMLMLAEAHAEAEGLTLEEYLAEPTMRFQGDVNFFTGLVEGLIKHGKIVDPERARQDVKIIFGDRFDRDGNEIKSLTTGFSCKRSQFEDALHGVATSISMRAIDWAEPLVLGDSVGATDSIDGDLPRVDYRTAFKHQGWNGNEPADPQK